MSYWPGNFGDKHDGVTIPTFWVALALSLLIHAAVLWHWLPNLRPPSPDETKLGEANGSLIVHLSPPPSPPPAPELLVQPAVPKSGPRPPVVIARPRPVPPVIALNRPPPNTQSPPAAAPPVATPAPVRPPAAGDFFSDLEARRRARGESSPVASAGTVATAPPVEDEKTRLNRIATANLGTQRAQTFGYDPRTGGGVFQIVHMGLYDAEFTFFGWNKDIRRNTKQQIEVRIGNNSDIRIAVVRKMISIIREYEKEDFRWESHRLGRSLTLSARMRDNAGLEEFMMREFFVNPRVPQ